MQWHRGDAVALDLPEATFDAVVCQHGLQFFGDRPAAARQMRRVLRDGGRAVVAVWRGLDQHPLYTALSDAELPHLTELGVAVSRADLEAPFSLGDPEALRELLTQAGFATVTLSAVSIEARFPDPDRFVARMEYAYAAVVPRFAEDPAAFTRYLDAIREATREVVARHRNADHIAVPMYATLAVARA